MAVVGFHRVAIIIGCDLGPMEWYTCTLILIPITFNCHNKLCHQSFAFCACNYMKRCWKSSCHWLDLGVYILCCNTGLDL